MAEVKQLELVQSLLLSSGICTLLSTSRTPPTLNPVLIDVIWQFLYWKVGVSWVPSPCATDLQTNFQFLWIDRRSKIESGQRTTSFSWLLNNKRSAIGKVLSMFPEQYRVEGFMFGQLRTCTLASTWSLLRFLFFSVCYLDRAPCHLPAVQQSNLECHFPFVHLLRQCMERRRILH